MGKLSRLKSMIRMSDLPLQHVDELTDFFDSMGATEQDIEAVIKLLDNDPGWYWKIYHNIQMKKKAFKDKDKEAWDSIVKKEQDIIAE